MTRHASHKRTVHDFLHAMAAAEAGEIAAVLARYSHADAVWEIFHPFNTQTGAEAVEATFWRPLKLAFPDYEQRIDLILAGEYEGRDWASTLGHVCGTLYQPWIGIPATYALTFLRFGMNALMRDGKIAKAYIYLDVVDVMRQADLYPFRQMPGSPEQWPAPPVGSGVDIDSCDPVVGAESIRIVREMQVDLPKMPFDPKTAGYSEHWHPAQNWYGPAGVGSSRGKRGFREYHARLFLQGFPDREGITRDPDGPEEGPGHYIRIGDGRLAVTGGWPSIYATHSGDGWLGLPPTGRRVEMRVADWYRLDENELIVENWVPIDVLHICAQIGYDVLADMRYFADRGLRRWPD